MAILRVVVFFVPPFWAPHLWFPSWHFVSHLQLFTYFSSLHKHHDSYSSFEFLSLSIWLHYSIFTTSSVSRHVFNFCYLKCILSSIFIQSSSRGVKILSWRFGMKCRVDNCVNNRTEPFAKVDWITILKLTKCVRKRFEDLFDDTCYVLGWCI